MNWYKDLIYAHLCTLLCSVLIHTQKDKVETEEQKENKSIFFKNFHSLKNNSKSEYFL